MAGKAPTNLQEFLEVLGGLGTSCRIHRVYETPKHLATDQAPLLANLAEIGSKCDRGPHAVVLAQIWEVAEQPNEGFLLVPAHIGYLRRYRLTVLPTDG